MPQNLTLFEPEPLLLKQQLSPILKDLAQSGLYVGTSSWKYEGWLGSIYEPDRYSTRGRFSKTQFERNCLKEFTEIFHTVSGDFAFYQFPTTDFWRGLFAQIPAGFRFAFKAPEEITTPAFAKHPRYGQRAGRINPLFLDAQAFIAQFLKPLEPYGSSVGVIIFEFPALLQKAFDDIGVFVDTLSKFFNSLPRTFSYAVEIRSQRFFRADYFGALRSHGVAHVFNSWTDVPSIREQMEDAETFTANFLVSRALTAPGQTYEETVSRFAPYNHVREPNESVRQALKDLLVRGKQHGQPVFLYVNNRLEGFSPGTILGVIEAFQATSRSETEEGRKLQHTTGSRAS